MLGETAGIGYDRVGNLCLHSVIERVSQKPNWECFRNAGAEADVLLEQFWAEEPGSDGVPHQR